MSEVITRERFLAATGRAPQDDDLERSNCPWAGHLGHTTCGWNAEQDKPQFEAMAHNLRGVPLPERLTDGIRDHWLKIAEEKKRKYDEMRRMKAMG